MSITRILVLVTSLALLLLTALPVHAGDYYPIPEEDRTGAALCWQILGEQPQDVADMPFQLLELMASENAYNVLTREWKQENLRLIGAKGGYDWKVQNAEDRIMRVLRARVKQGLEYEDQRAGLLPGPRRVIRYALIWRSRTRAFVVAAIARVNLQGTMPEARRFEVLLDGPLGEPTKILLVKDETEPAPDPGPPPVRPRSIRGSSPAIPPGTREDGWLRPGMEVNRSPPWPR